MRLPTLSLLFSLIASGLAYAAEVPLVVDPAQSRVEIVVKATVDSFVGRLSAYDAQIVVDPDAREVRQARVAFRFRDVKTGKADRDEAMHEWQDTAKHPDGLFVLSRLARGADGAMTATGTLTLHGAAREISFPVSIVHDGDRYAIDGEAALDVQHFGLPIIRKFMVLKVDPIVRVRFHLQGAPAAAVKG